MIVKTVQLSNNIFLKSVAKMEIRQGFGEGLLTAGERDERVIALTADLKESTRMHLFAEKFPERFFDCGVAEQAMITIASGMANYGKIPFCASYAIFTPGRTWEQIRTTICLNDVPVKIVGSHAGFSAGLDGGNHQGLEDLAAMRVLPNMTVLTPCDGEETIKAVVACTKLKKPVYIRTLKGETPLITTKKTPFAIGKIELFWGAKEGINPQAAVFACGPGVYEALMAARKCSLGGIELQVFNVSTIKPLDTHTVIRAAKICGAVVTVEEHQASGGLGSVIAETLIQNYPVPVEIVAVNDSFGETGRPDDLRKKYGLTAENIVNAVKKVIIRKRDH